MVQQMAPMRSLAIANDSQSKKRRSSVKGSEGQNNWIEGIDDDGVRRGPSKE